MTSPIVAGELLNSTAANYRAQGYAAQQKGNFDQALAYYMKAVSLGDKSALICNDIGVVYEEMSIYDRAAYSYEQAISLDPNYLAPYLNLAYLYKEQGNNEQALKYFRERYERGGVKDPRRDKIRKEILALDPSYKDRIIKSELENTSQVMQEKARENFDQDVERAERHYTQAKKFLAANEFDRAMGEFDRALAMTPDNPKIIREKKQAVYNHQIEAIKVQASVALKKLEAGDTEAARTEFLNILAIIPKEPTPKSE